MLNSKHAGLIVLVMFSLAGCYHYVDVQPTEQSIASTLQKSGGKDLIMVWRSHGEPYTLTDVAVLQDTLYGTRLQSRRPSGTISIPVSDIDKISIREVDNPRTLVFLGAIPVATALVIYYLRSFRN